ncbi:MAG: hypothetical protein ACTSRH_03295 [Promethearchaeota archaeon]
MKRKKNIEWPALFYLVGFICIIIATIYIDIYGTFFNTITFIFGTVAIISLIIGYYLFEKEIVKKREDY